MKVRVYKASRNTMQSGRANSKLWRIEPELETARVPDPIMGWATSGDTLNQIRMRFSTYDEALRFAEKQGWEVQVQEPHERRVTPRNFADNFKVRRTSA